MLKSIKISLKDTIVYGLGNMAIKFVGLLLIPVYLDQKFFTVDDFGRIGLLEISALVLTAFLASGLPQSLTRWFWDKEHKGNQKGIFFMSLSTQIVVSLAFCVLLIPLSGKLSAVIFSKPDWGRVISLVIISSAIQAVNNIINTLMRLQSKSVLYTVTNLFKLGLVLSLTLYFIISKKMGLEGIIWHRLLATAFQYLFSLVILLKTQGYFSIKEFSGR